MAFSRYLDKKGIIKYTNDFIEKNGASLPRFLVIQFWTFWNDKVGDGNNCIDN